MERAEAEAILDGDRETAVALLMQVGELIEANRRLEVRVAELEQRLNRSSRNSSLPPSQDPPSAPPRPRKPGSGRSPGGQPGHEGRHRPLLPLERMSEVVDHWPERCPACARVFGAAERIESAPAQRQQIAELPPIAVRVSEHRLHRLRCPDCGATTRAELPADVPAGAFGPRLKAAVATLSVRNRLSRRDLGELLDELFGCALSTGSVDAILQRTSATLEPAYQGLLEQVRAAPAVNVDETGWRLQGKQRTLWGAFTGSTAVFRLAPSRHNRELRALLGEEFSGIVSSDRWAAYDTLDPAKRQVCWSHLLRDFAFHAEAHAPAQKQFGDHGIAIAKGVFHAWQQFQDDGDRAALTKRIAPLKNELQTLLERGSHGKRYKRTLRFSKNLLRVWPALWTFTTTPAVEPTNNAAERGLRGAVIYRKLSLGSQSPTGEHMIERLLSVSQTCRLQHRSMFAYISNALTAKARGDPIPALA